VPTFTWLEDQFSPDGIPLLSINFHDGKPNDVAILKQFNPIPRQRKEREENIDKCIFNGYLRDESTVYVTLTGGCPFDKTFDVRMTFNCCENHIFICIVIAFLCAKCQQQQSKLYLPWHLVQ
jgi:hypothetical protein